MQPTSFDSLEECLAKARQELSRFQADPRFAQYERQLTRPEIKWCRLLRCLLKLDGAGCLISLIRIYQRFAPMNIRRRCRFEPSCSEYMVLAIQKYGMKSGFLKGVDRIKRCGSGDGGYDYP